MFSIMHFWKTKGTLENESSSLFGVHWLV